MTTRDKERRAGTPRLQVTGRTFRPEKLRGLDRVLRRCAARAANARRFVAAAYVQLARAHSQGAPWRALSEACREAGVVIAPDTLRRYMAMERDERGADGAP